VGAGPIHSNSFLGVDGLPLMPVTGPAFRLDPESGESTRLLDGSDCRFADLAVDGTVACFEPGRPAVLDVLRPPGQRLRLDLPQPGFAQAGAVSRPGLRPGDGSWAWLPDGTVIAYRPLRSPEGVPGIYLVAPSGAARQLTSSGTPIGVMTEEVS
jgi:hypothetical protein